MLTKIVLLSTCSTLLLGCVADTQKEDQRYQLTVQVIRVLNDRIEKLEKKTKVHVPASQRIHFQ